MYCRRGILHPEQNLWVCAFHLVCGLHYIPPGTSRYRPAGLWFQKGGPASGLLPLFNTYFQRRTYEIGLPEWCWHANFGWLKLFRWTGSMQKLYLGLGVAVPLEYWFLSFLEMELYAFLHCWLHYKPYFVGRERRGISERIYGVKSVKNNWPNFLEELLYLNISAWIFTNIVRKFPSV